MSGLLYNSCGNLQGRGGTGRLQPIVIELGLIGQPPRWLGRFNPANGVTDLHHARAHVGGLFARFVGFETGMPWAVDGGAGVTLHGTRGAFASLLGVIRVVSTDVGHADLVDVGVGCAGFAFNIIRLRLVLELGA